MKVALVYDRVNKFGGAERILLVLKELFPDAPLFTSVYDAEKTSWARAFSIKTSFLQKLPFAKNNHEYYATCMPLVFESFTFDEFDLVISVTSEAAKGIITKPTTKHICICLTPTRYLWSGYEEYFKNPLLKFLSRPVVSYLRFWDKIAAQRPDMLIAISEEVQNRIKKYYDRSSDVIYPPVDLHVKGINKVFFPKDKDYFLIVSRLVPYKKIDLAIHACNEMGVKLKIIGSGSDEKRLRKIAGPMIEFLGNIPDQEVAAYYMGSSGFLFPGLEDFGITILEAQGFGKPVLAYKGGGAIETIIPGKTGMFFFPQTKEALKDKLQEFRNYQFSSIHTITQANSFSKERFKKEFMERVEKMLSNTLE